MNKLRIGLVDLDTSHPGSFIPVLQEMGHVIAAVYDGGSIHPPGYAEKFAQDHGIAHVCDTIQEMVGLVDAAFIHGCNWDQHVERSRPFVEAGVAVFIDKPLAGNIGDLRQIAEWVQGGARITGGSSLMYSRELQEWHGFGVPKEEWVYAIAGCSVDEFNYGIHAFSMLHGLMGPGVRHARYIGTGGGQRQLELTWMDGRRGIVNVGKTAAYLPSYANVVTQKRVDFIKIDSSRLYRALLEAIMPYLAGDGPAPLPIGQLIEVELSAIAAKLSYERGGAVIALPEIPDGYAGYDGAAFAVSYKEMKYPKAR